MDDDTFYVKVELMGIHRYPMWQICRSRQTTSTEIVQWCIENFGSFETSGVPIWEVKYSSEESALIWIYDDHHAMMFALKWL